MSLERVNLTKKNLFELKTFHFNKKKNNNNSNNNKKKIKKIIIMIKLCWGSTNYSVAQRIIWSVYAWCLLKNYADF